MSTCVARVHQPGMFATVPCSRTAREGSDYCWQHEPKPEPEPRDALAQPVVTVRRDLRVALRWPPETAPRWPDYTGLIAWTNLRVIGDADAPAPTPDELPLSGSGYRVKRDGTVGQVASTLGYARLADKGIPPGVRKAFAAAWAEATR